MITFCAYLIPKKIVVKMKISWIGWISWFLHIQISWKFGVCLHHVIFPFNFNWCMEWCVVWIRTRHQLDMCFKQSALHGQKALSITSSIIVIIGGQPMCSLRRKQLMALIRNIPFIWAPKKYKNGYGLYMVSLIISY